MTNPRYTRKQGRLLMFCPTCTENDPQGHHVFFVSTDRNFQNVCPRCHTYLLQRECTRCHHRWTPRTSELARVCPSCKSPYWCRQSIRSRPTGWGDPQYHMRKKEKME